MDLTGLFGASFVDWEAVAASWTKRTVPSRLLLFAARGYLEAAGESVGEPNPDRVLLLEATPLPAEVKRAFAAPPDPEAASASTWGTFVDAAVAAELEMVPYGERPVLLSELRAGLAQAAEEAEGSTLARWFLGRREALPGGDLPEGSGYLPV